MVLHIRYDVSTRTVLQYVNLLTGTIVKNLSVPISLIPITKVGNRHKMVVGAKTSQSQTVKYQQLAACVKIYTCMEEGEGGLKHP